MRGLRALALLVAVCGIIRADSSIFSGFLGCRFSESLCRQNEQCIDDHLFGTCQSLDQSPDTYQYYLTTGQLHALEKEISQLIQSGNTWDDLYTQCVLANVLLAFREGRSYDPDFCKSEGIGHGKLEEEMTDAMANLLQSYLQDYYQSSAEQKERLEYPDLDDYDAKIPVDKKDEVVKVHKYLKSHKRDPLQSDYEELEAYYPGHQLGRGYLETAADFDGADQDNGRYLSGSNEEDGGDDDDDYDMDEFLESLSPEKLRLLQEYLGPLTPKKSELDTVPSQSTAVEAEEQDYEEGLSPSPPHLTDDDYAVVAPIDVEDAKILDQLLQGKLTVSDLDDDQIRHLSDYVDGILEPLRKYADTGITMETEDDIPNDLVNQLLDTDKNGEDVNVDDGTSHDDENDDDTAGDGQDGGQADTVPNKEQLNSDLPESDAETSLEVEKKIHPNNPHGDITTPKQPQIGIVDLDQAYIKLNPVIHANKENAALVLVVLERHLGLDPESFTDIVVGNDEINFRVNPNSKNLNASEVASLAKGVYREEIKNQTGFDIYDAGIGQYGSGIPVDVNRPRYFVLTFVLCGVILGIVLSVIAIYIVRRHLQSKEKLAQLSTAADGVEASSDYQDLCRQRMQSKSSERPEPLHISSRVGSVSASEGAAVRSPSSRSSTSSRSEEPVVTNMDISTGHIVLSYMEDHLKNKDRLDQEWEALCVYEAEPNSTSIASDPANVRKNKYSDVLPYDHSRVILSASTNVSGSDYINASTITDHDPRNPAYICTQGPLPHTVADFWQMVWEQGSVVIVNLTKLMENGQSMCHRYWPEEGSDLYHIYEVHLVSEHIWCDEYLVRCFYLKNLQTNETRTVSQFHFLAWPDLGIPTSPKALLDFRRKVNKSYRGQNCPIVVHCSDGSGRTGCYCLLDMVLNRMSKGAKEIDIAATLEHIRDQRMNMVRTKEQFEFVLVAVAEEVHAILKALPQ